MDCTMLLDDVRAVVEDSGAAERTRFLAHWPAAAVGRPVAPASLAVLHWLPLAAREAPAGATARLAHRVAAAAAALQWRQSYRAGDVSAAFLERYGWCELVGGAGPVHCAALAAGVLLLGPDTHYPAHRHAAEELYVPLSGSAAWQRGDGPFVVRHPGAAVFHASGERHAMRTAAAPLLALYLWRGTGLGESAVLDLPAPHDRV